MTTNDHGDELTPVDLEAFELRWEALVDENIAGPHRQFVQGVFEPDGTKPSYCYTIGRTRLGLPELCIIGLNPNVGCYVLNMIAKREREDGLVLTENMILEELVEGDFLMTVRTMADEKVIDLAERSVIRAADEDPNAERGYAMWQVIYQDKDHRWPWEIPEPDIFHLIEPCLTNDGTWANWRP